jgi:hypothetical protein
MNLQCESCTHISMFACVFDSAPRSERSADAYEAYNITTPTRVSSQDDSQLVCSHSV